MGETMSEMKKEKKKKSPKNEDARPGRRASCAREHTLIKSATFERVNHRH